MWNFIIALLPYQGRKRYLPNYFKSKIKDFRDSASKVLGAGFANPAPRLLKADDLPLTNYRSCSCASLWSTRGGICESRPQQQRAHEPALNYNRLYRITPSNMLYYSWPQCISNFPKLCWEIRFPFRVVIPVPVYSTPARAYRRNPAGY
jgi:hypothetical protein